MKTDPEPLARRALSALAEQCEIPADVEERILAAALAPEPAPPPIVPLPAGDHAPLTSFLRSAREEDRRWRRLGWVAGAAVLAMALVVASTGRPGRPRHAGAPRALVPPDAHPHAGGTVVPDGHPRLEEARTAMLAVAARVAQACTEGAWSAVVRFETAGDATVLDVASGAPGEEGCITRIVAGARVRPQAGPRLAVRYEVAAARDGRPAARISGWLVDRT